MPRNRETFALIENETDRKVSYKKRHIWFLKKSQELDTVCDIEMVAIIYSPYSDEPKVFPNHGVAINTFQKFKEFSTFEISKNMVTREEFTDYIIKKNIQLVREEMKKNVDDEGSTSNVPQSTPSTTMTSMMQSSIIDPLLYAPMATPMTPEMDPSAEIPPIGASNHMNNYLNYSTDIPQSPSLNKLLNWNNDDVMTFIGRPITKQY
ncbi:hypothetical protein R3W88_008064 [Solanum pinnatisectum]|uniref:MADS-box domain-containing protein n=1 Tax=Solanum pinnatisectum TaxID=50273 RepID=A0AAV9M7T3_9SOLN|nr:hypothetical protein R3W88_008064 [Solanum pinnatisectum]